ncbi:hypothetical protein GCM10008935_28130 [Alkalibacillus silvisoli]|uniref:Lantibiotic n=1 Tax=Alkalibacillus silvisoli TaxID=392823 RepID=A0ABP3K3E1_9BACI
MCEEKEGTEMAIEKLDEKFVIDEKAFSELLPPLTTLTGCLKWGLLG